MFLNSFKKLKTVLSDYVESSEIYGPPRKIYIGRDNVDISLANLINILLMITVVTIIILSNEGIIPAIQVGFYCKDPLISHKYTGDTVTPEVLGVTAVLLVVLAILSSEMLIHQSFKKINILASWLLIKESLTGVAAVLFLTSVAKLLVGEHRPHFFDVCDPDTAKNCTEGSFVETFTCTSEKYTSYQMFDSSVSFPSGHSSVAWCTGMYCAYIVHARLPTINAGTLMKPFLISVCLTWSLICSLSRITDRRHHWWDVLAGAILGILGSLYSIRVVHRKLQRMNFVANDVKVDSVEMV